MAIGLDVLGGIGKGLMQGTQFVQQKNMQDEQLALQMRQASELSQMRQAQAARLDEDQQWQRQDRARLEQERQQQADYQTLFREVAGELGENATPETLGAEVLKRGLRSGRIPQAEVQPLMAQASKLRALGVTNAFRRGDVAELSRIMSGPGQYNRPVRMELSKGQDEFGQPSDRYRVVDETGQTLADFSPLQLGSILGADDLLDEYEQRTKIKQAQSATRENEAQARAADALAQQRRTAPTGGLSGGRSAAANPTTGFSAATREEATRAALARKVAEGRATPEEADMFRVLQDRAAQASDSYTPVEAKRADYWRNAGPQAVEAEVERQLAAIRLRSTGDVFLERQFEDPEYVEMLRHDIRAKLGAAPTGAAQPGRGSADGMTGQRPATATTGNGTATSAPRDLSQFLR